MNEDAPKTEEIEKISNNPYANNPFSEETRNHFERAIAIEEASKRCETWIQYLDNLLKEVRENRGNQSKLDLLKKETEECLSWKTSGVNIYARRRNNLRKKASEINEEFGFALPEKDKLDPSFL